MPQLWKYMLFVPWLVFLGAATLEVGGDAIIRHGLRGSRLAVALAGCAILAAYGLLVNSLKWDFSKLLGVYVGFFACVSILAGRFLFHEKVPMSTWLGLGLVIAGCAIIQFGHH
jgi:small multidrug resistance family-3 protein